MNFLASADAKPRLKWSAELHQNFIEAIHQLGGPDKATPKSLMTVMGVPGLTLFHLKSHLQKYRLGKNQQSETNVCSGEEDVKNIHSNDEKTVRHEDKTEKITQALQMQMEVQRRLHEQIKVQRRLQMRIEAQGKYLQSILKTAHESLSGYCSSSRSVELAKAELSQLASMVNTDRNGCSFTKPAENEWLLIHSNNDEDNQMRTISTESSFELSEISGIEEEKQQVNKPGRRAEFSLLDIHRDGNERNGMKNHAIGAKRSGSTISDGSCSDMKMKKVRLSEMIDLNS